LQLITYIITLLWYYTLGQTLKLIGKSIVEGMIFSWFENCRCGGWGEVTDTVQNKGEHHNWELIGRSIILMVKLVNLSLQETVASVDSELDLMITAHHAHDVNH